MKDISYCVNELKYLGVHVIARQHLRFSVQHRRSNFCRTFNSIHSKSEVSSSEIITVEPLNLTVFDFLDERTLQFRCNIRLLSSYVVCRDNRTKLGSRDFHKKVA